jgi:hypothetical protein
MVVIFNSPHFCFRSGEAEERSSLNDVFAMPGHLCLSSHWHSRVEDKLPGMTISGLDASSGA